MTEEKNSKEILTIFQRCKNTPVIVYDEGFKTNDKVFDGILKQFLNNKKHIEAVKKIDEGDYTKEYFEENLPHYSSKLYNVLEKCSLKKSHDDKLALRHKEGSYNISFD